MLPQVRIGGWDAGLDYLPLELLSELEYCPRRFWLIYVQGEVYRNAPARGGDQRHQRADGKKLGRGREPVVYRRVYVWSDRLRLSGFADVVETEGELWVPVEYKHGQMGRWLNDHIQLCAQAMCLEERSGQPITRGKVFYRDSRRCTRVDITAELRARTENSLAWACTLLDAAKMPLPIDNRARCHDCPFESICLPREVLQLLREG